MRVRFAGAVLVRVKNLRCGFVSAGAGADKFFGAGNNINDLLLVCIFRSLDSTEKHCQF